ncbi:UNVERIFIED_CONTAM: hypothetical protein PYX00_003179 [Menopon gallinae]|uniref:U3 small nucleolar RNA-associated protein 14 homolog A n=1 Tax=Menopon gallinae TaxID=328185 RepID=A0AAW2HZV6_9NEOP
MKLDENCDSDGSEDEQQYAKLLNAVTQLDSTQRVKAPVRKELSSVVSEFHLPKASDSRELVRVEELTAALKKKQIKKKVKSVIRKAKTLKKPLEKPVAERLQRAAGYGSVRGQLKKWNAVVEKNRVADHLSFPLQQGRVTLQSSQQFLNKFKTETPLETEMMKILKGEKKEIAELKKKENENLEFPLTYEEMMEKKKEMAKFRAKMSYQEAKAHRQNKIKSKKYHRILKREKVKQQLKEFEQLQKTDPEAALKKLEELDKTRAQERASLRHKNTGKWARNLAVRAKYDKDSRKVLAEQLKLSRDLTEKVKNADSEDDVSDQENAADTAKAPAVITTSNDNPWALGMTSEVTDFVSGFRKYWENVNKGAESSTVKNSDNAPADIGAKNSESAVHTETVSVEKDVNKSVEPVETVKKSTETVKTVDKKGKSPKKKKDAKTEQKKNDKSEGKKEKIEKGGKKVHSTSGSWTVVEVTDEDKGGSKRKCDVDLDDLFEDLNEKLEKKTVKRLKKVKKTLTPKTKRKRAKANEGRSTEDDLDLSMKKNPASLRPNEDAEMIETAGNGEAVSSEQTVPTRVVAAEKDAAEVQQIDPSKFIEVKPKKLNTKLPDNVEGEEDYLDDDDGTAQKMNIVEAFDADDVMEEFQEMKKEEEDGSKMEVAGELPGWGSWGGSGIKPRERKTKRKGMISVPELPKRKDHDREDIIIREMSNAKTVEHMVKDVPFPFQSVGAFESNLRHPIGREWVPESAHRKFVKKPVETQIGTVIEPMDENELVRLKKERKSLYKAKKKEMKK